MENLNAEQVKKALTVHSHIKHPTMVDCSACAYIWSESCREVLATDALALINSQEQRIKELEAETKRLESLCVSKDIIIGDLSKENERLKARVLEENHLRHQVEEILANGMSVVRADTVRKMQEMLKTAFTLHSTSLGLVVLVSDIDRAGEIMLEGKDEIRD